MLHVLRILHGSYEASLCVLSCGSDLFPRWFRVKPGDCIDSNSPAGSSGIDTTSGSGGKRLARKIFGIANQRRVCSAMFKCTVDNILHYEIP